MKTDDWQEKYFWPKVEPAGFCWLWTGAKSANGYGNFITGRKRGESIENVA